jgi:hypothetical protein
MSNLRRSSLRPGPRRVAGVIRNCLPLISAEMTRMKLSFPRPARETAAARRGNDIVDADQTLNRPLGHHTPGHLGRGIVAIGLHSDTPAGQGRIELGTCRGPEHEAPMVHDIVDREYSGWPAAITASRPRSVLRNRSQHWLAERFSIPSGISEAVMVTVFGSQRQADRVGRRIGRPCPRVGGPDGVSRQDKVYSGSIPDACAGGAHFEWPAVHDGSRIPKSQLGMVSGPGSDASDLACNRYPECG